MAILRKSVLWVLGCLGFGLLSAQETPYLDEATFNPSPEGTWNLIPALSDEFDTGSPLDTDKWLTSPETYQGWRGRVPGLFSGEAISIQEGELCIEASQFPAPLSHRGKTWTHQGGLVRSRQAARPGIYTECRMRANQTFMSSTFWLINQASEAGEGCERRVTELDVQECVGQVTGKGAWAQEFDRSMHSNTHHRYPGKMDCGPKKSEGNNALIEKGKVYEDYHVYGVWWKSPEEVLFFLDGEHQYTVHPPSEFNLPMYLMMVVETYDWNPPAPGSDGMNLPAASRTTRYDWVRTWEWVEKE